MKSFDVSVIIPAYNEEAIIERSVTVAYNILKKTTSDFEIVVINDGSIDQTKNILNSKFGAIPEIVISHNAKNEGFGSAIKKGIQLAQKEHVFCVPTDSPMTEELYYLFSSYAHKADILVSYRKKRVGYSALKLFNSSVYHFLISFIFSINLKDYNWIHLYHKKIFDDHRMQIESKGIFMLAEVLIRAKSCGYSFFEFEVEQTERLTGIATASKLTAILETLRELLLFKIRN